MFLDLYVHQYNIACIVLHMYKFKKNHFCLLCCFYILKHISGQGSSRFKAYLYFRFDQVREWKTTNEHQVLAIMFRNTF